MEAGLFMKAAGKTRTADLGWTVLRIFSNSLHATSGNRDSSMPNFSFNHSNLAANLHLGCPSPFLSLSKNALNVASSSALGFSLPAGERKKIGSSIRLLYQKPSGF